MKNNGRILCLIGGSGLIIGSLLPWASITATLFGTRSLIGIEGDGIFSAAAGALIILLAIITKTKPGKSFNLFIVLLSVLSIILIVSKFISIGEAFKDTPVGIDSTLGSGLYISAIAPFFSIVGGLISAPEESVN